MPEPKLPFGVFVMQCENATVALEVKTVPTFLYQFWGYGHFSPAQD